MSVHYPIALAEAVEETRQRRVLVDEFEAGNSASRGLWPARTFKRKFRISHTGITRRELDHLTAFHRAQGGAETPFWFRDNAGRGGNARVRFSGPLQANRKAQAYDVQVELEEVAPVIMLPGLMDIYAITGVAPVAWFDPNRDTYQRHLDEITIGDAWDQSETEAHAVWSGSSLLAGVTSQWQRWAFLNSSWARTVHNLSGFSGTKPACSIFTIARAPTSSAAQVLASHGTYSYSGALGIQLNASNYWTPFIAAGTEVYSGARQLNSPADTWRSIAAVWTASIDTVNFYADGQLQPTDSISRSYVAGAASLGADTNGGKKFSGDLATALVFNATLTTDQVKALHNLFAFQTGLTIVP